MRKPLKLLLVLPLVLMGVTLLGQSEDNYEFSDARRFSGIYTDPCGQTHEFGIWISDWKNLSKDRQVEQFANLHFTSNSGLKISQPSKVSQVKLNERLEESVTYKGGYCTIISTPFGWGNSTRYTFIVGRQLNELFPKCKHEVPVTAQNGSGAPSRSTLLEAAADCLR